MNFTVQQRELTGKGNNRKLRQDGNTPGIVYGKGDPLSVSMSSNKAHKFIHSLGGRKKLFSLEIEKDGKSSAIEALVQDYQVSNWGNHLLHVDFMEVTQDSIMTVEVPIEPTGDSKAVKLGGTLNIIRRSVPVRCAVKDIPTKFIIDVKELLLGDSIHVLDIDYPEGVKPVVTGRNWTVITVSGKAKEEEEEEVTEEVAEGEETEEAATE